jgi:hypothetical protein
MCADGSFDFMQFRQCLIDIAALMLEDGNPVLCHALAVPHLLKLIVVDLVQIQKTPNVSQAEPKPFAATDQHQACAIAPAEDPNLSLTLWV